MRHSLSFLILSTLILSSCSSFGDSSGSPSDVDPSSSDTSISSEHNSSDTATDTSTGASPSESTGEVPVGEYRLNPVPGTGNIGFVYDEYGQVLKEIYKDEYYTDVEDVAAYIVAFNDVPDNYYFTTERNGYGESKDVCYGLYGNECRIYPGPYESNYSFLPYSLDDVYNEADIGGDGYAESSSWNRGALRVVFTLGGIYEYGNNIPVVFYTDNHYDTFYEYKNYVGGWGPEFGENGYDWSPIETWF